MFKLTISKLLTNIFLKLLLLEYKPTKPECCTAVDEPFDNTSTSNNVVP